MDNDEEEAKEDELDDETPAEKLARMKRVKGRFNHFLSEVAEDMMSKGEMDKFRKVVYSKLRDEGITIINANQLKAFAAGFEFGVASHHSLGHDLANLHGGLQKLIREKDPTKIDITKSKPIEE